MFEKGDRVRIIDCGNRPEYLKTKYKIGTIKAIRDYYGEDIVFYVEFDDKCVNPINRMTLWTYTMNMLEHIPDGITANIMFVDDITKENKMEILEIYYERKLSKLLDNKNEELAKAQKKDENYVKIQNLADELAKLSKVTTMTFGIEYNNYEYCDEVKSLFVKIENKYNQKTRELTTLRQEVEAQLSMCETYEQKQNVLRNYEIIDEKGKINA